ncbi:MAG: peptidase M13, partial [Chthoniobacteraceae bacterium]
MKVSGPKAILATSLLTLLGMSPLFAHDGHECGEVHCALKSVFNIDAGTAGGGSSEVEAKRHGAWGIDLAGMDPSVKPGDDFFAYVNGTWAKTTPIPDDRSSYGAFAALRELSEARVQKLVAGYKVGDPAKDGDQAKVAALYQAFMDEAAVEALDAKPLLPKIEAIRAVETKEQIAALMGKSIGGLGSSFFSLFVSPDAKNPDFYALHIPQSGLGLGDREMYLNAKFVPQKEQYQQYVAQMLRLVGWPESQEAAARVVALETQIAEAHWSRPESRNRDKTHNPLKTTELASMAPDFPWPVFLQAAGVDQVERAILIQNTALPKLAKIFAGAELEALKAWQAFHTADKAAGLLSKRFVDAQFEFRSKFLQGQPKQRERWKRAVAFAENAMGEAIGRDYVGLYYPPEAKAIMDKMVADLRVAMKTRSEGLSW